MTRVTFHFGADDKWHYASRLLRKATQNGAKVAVVAHSSDVARVDADLWALAPTEFVPHCLSDAAASVLRRSPVVIAACEGSAKKLDGSVLLNLSGDIPVGFDAYERLIEVVSIDETERQQARMRWKHYAGAGLTIEKHDIQNQGAR